MLILLKLLGKQCEKMKENVLTYLYTLFFW